MNVKKLPIFILLLWVSLSSISAFSSKNQAIRTIWHPYVYGERLDYCSADGRECGQQVANRYCRMLGYHRSGKSKIAHNVGLTHYIDTRLQCKGWTCNGFMNINCVTNLSHNPPKPYHYRERQFFYPRFAHYRLAWCYEKNKACGSKAANSYCKRLGYLGAKHFEKQSQISATKTLGSQELCFGRTCKAFKSIICYR